MDLTLIPISDINQAGFWILVLAAFGFGTAILALGTSSDSSTDSQDDALFGGFGCGVMVGAIISGILIWGSIHLSFR